MNWPTRKQYMEIIRFYTYNQVAGNKLVRKLNRTKRHATSDRALKCSKIFGTLGLKKFSYRQRPYLAQTDPTLSNIYLDLLILYIHFSHRPRINMQLFCSIFTWSVIELYIYWCRIRILSNVYFPLTTGRYYLTI